MYRMTEDAETGSVVQNKGSEDAGVNPATVLVLAGDRHGSDEVLANLAAVVVAIGQGESNPLPGFEGDGPVAVGIIAVGIVEYRQGHFPDRGVAARGAAAAQVVVVAARDAFRRHVHDGAVEGDVVGEGVVGILVIPAGVVGIDEDLQAVVVPIEDGGIGLDVDQRVIDDFRQQVEAVGGPEQLEAALEVGRFVGVAEPALVERVEYVRGPCCSSIFLDCS